MNLVIDPFVMTSAVLYALAFILPAWCHWFVFIFLIPLYWYTSLHMSDSPGSFALQGFWWGIIFFSMHMHGLLYMLLQHTTFVGCLLTSMLLVGYCSIISAMWFAIAAFLARKVSQKFLLLNLCIWVFVTCCYIAFIDCLLFRIICLPRGYVFAHPLIPLAHYEPWIAALALFSPWVFIVCLASSSAYIIYIIIHKKSRLWLLLLLLFFSPYIGGWFMLQTKEPALCQDMAFKGRLVYVQPPEYRKDMIDVLPIELAHHINTQLRRALQQFPQAISIFFPESTFPFPLDLYEEAWQLWAENTLFGPFDQVLVIMGAHHSCQEKRSNTIFCFNSRRIMQTYDKTTYLPFAEYMPWPWNKSNFFSELLLKNKKEFQRIKKRCDPISLAPDMVVCPYLCSDLFFNVPRPDDTSDMILWLINDSWFVCSYYRHLMFLCAKLQANLYKKTFLYIAHEFGAYIRPFERHHYLSTVMTAQKI